MLSRLRFTARSTLIYSIGTIGTKLIGLILLPIYTDKLTTDQYGMWSILEITSQIFVISIGLRMSTALLRFFSSNNESKYRNTVVFTAFWVTLFSVAIFNLLMHPFVTNFSVLFFDTTAYASYFNLLIVWTSFEIFNRLVLDLIRGKEKPLFYIIVTIIKFTLVLLLNIYFIVFRDRGIDGIILSQLIGSLSMFIITLPFLIKEMSWSINLSIFKEMFRYSFPLIFSGLSGLLLAVGDRYFVKYFLDYHEVGVYSLSYKISNVLKIVFVQSFQLGFLPIAFNMFDKPNSERFFSKVLTYYIFILFWSGLIISLFSKELIYILSSSDTYYEAYLYIPIITLAICFSGIQNFFVLGIHYAKKTKFIALIIFISLSVNIVSNILLIPLIGLYGAAVSFALASLVMAILNFRKSQQYLPIKYELKKLFIIFLIAVGLYFISLLTGTSTLLVSILVKSALVIAYPFLLYLFNFYEKIELERILGAWKKWRNPASWKKNIRKMVNGEIDNEIL